MALRFSAKVALCILDEARILDKMVKSERLVGGLFGLDSLSAVVHEARNLVFLSGRVSPPRSWLLLAEIDVNESLSVAPCHFEGSSWVKFRVFNSPDLLILIFLYFFKNLRRVIILLKISHKSRLLPSNWLDVEAGRPFHYHCFLRLFVETSLVVCWQIVEVWPLKLNLLSKCFPLILGQRVGVVPAGEYLLPRKIVVELDRPLLPVIARIEDLVGIEIIESVIMGVQFTLSERRSVKLSIEV